MMKRASRATVAMTKTNKTVADEARHGGSEGITEPGVNSTVVMALARLMAPPINAIMLQLIRLL